MQRLLSLLVVLLVGSIALNACGGSGKESTTEATATEALQVATPSLPPATSTSPAVTANSEPGETATLAEPTKEPKPVSTAPAEKTELVPIASPTPLPQASTESMPEATPWIPASELPADQTLGLPDVDAHYAIHITEINVDTGFVRAEQVVTISAFRKGVPDALYFQVVPVAYGFFTMDSIAVNGQPVEQVTINNGFTYVVALDPAIVDPGSGNPVEIAMHFHLDVGFEPTGWGYTAYDADVLRLGYWAPLISTDHPYTDTFDPSFTRIATFDVTMDIAPGIDFAYTGEISIREDLPDGRIRYQMHAENVRDFDLILSRSYVRQSATSASGVFIEYYWRSGASPENADYVLSVAADAIDQLTDLLGPYPYPTLRLADAGPSMPGGVEFGNLIYVLPAYQTLDRLIYHEVAHQWFYGIIGNRTMRDGWIDEGGAEFFERGLPTGFTEVPQIPASGYQYPLDSTYLEIPNIWPDWYYAIYEQGARLYYDVLGLMGWDDFWAAMRALYDRYRFDIVTAWDLLRLWQSHSDVDLRPLFDDYFRYSWIDDLAPPGATTHQGWLPILS